MGRLIFSSCFCCSVDRSSPILCSPMDCNTPDSSQRLLRFMSFESVMLSNHLILCCPLLLLPSIFTIIRVFSSESVLPINQSKYWSFIFSISPSSEYPGLIFFWIDWILADNLQTMKKKTHNEVTGDNGMKFENKIFSVIYIL